MTGSSLENQNQTISVEAPDQDNQPLDPQAHAFDRPDFRDYLDVEFPGYAGLIEAANRPTVSAQPDDMERWEAEQITARKAPMDHEPPGMYLRRLLYEESFSVNQNPGLPEPETFLGTAGMTPGGLISHYYKEGTYNGVSMADISAWSALDEPNFSEAMARLGSGTHIEALNLLEQVHRLVDPSAMRSMYHMVQRYTTGKQQPPTVYDAIGYRLLKMLHTTPDMLEPVEDTELQARFTGSHQGQPMSRASLMVQAWHRSQVLLPGGHFTSADTPETTAAVENLLILRTHPETQVFFKYLSPSGYINEATQLAGSAEQTL